MTTNEFWNWFASNAAELRPHRITSALATELQSLLDDLVGYVDWEIGPVGDGRRAFFSLSPTSRDAAVNDAARTLIAAAPTIEGWDIQLYKPPRQWEMAFSIDVGHRRIPIEGERWLVLLEADGSGHWEVTFVCDDEVARLPQEALIRAAWTLVDGELGTETSRSILSAVKVSKKPIEGAIPLTRGLLRRTISNS